jgi:hypothetical protein
MAERPLISITAECGFSAPSSTGSNSASIGTSHSWETGIWHFGEWRTTDSSVLDRPGKPGLQPHPNRLREQQLYGYGTGRATKLSTGLYSDDGKKGALSYALIYYLNRWLQK